MEDGSHGREALLGEEPLERDLGDEWALACHRVAFWAEEEACVEASVAEGVGARMKLEKQYVHATLDFVGPCRDFGPKPASSRVGGMITTCSHWCFPRFFCLHF